MSESIPINELGEQFRRFLLGIDPPQRRGEAVGHLTLTDADGVEVIQIPVSLALAAQLEATLKAGLRRASDPGERE